MRFMFRGATSADPDVCSLFSRGRHTDLTPVFDGDGVGEPSAHFYRPRAGLEGFLEGSKWMNDAGTV